MLYNLFRLDYSTIIGCILLIIFIMTNRMMDRRVTQLFKIGAFSVLALAIVDSLELWAASWSYPSSFRILMSVIGYVLRPMIIYIIICILCRDQKMRLIVGSIPLFLLFACCLSAFFSPVMFSYDSNNEFVRGPLGLLPFIVSAFYLFIMLILTIRHYEERGLSESLFSFFLIIFTVISVVAEVALKTKGSLNITCALAIIFYYMYFLVQQFKRDPLTNLLNRHCFYLDIASISESLYAIISLDLNNLKTINDKEGHNAGDLAICTVVKCIKNVLPHGYSFYRVGGDEFMILCKKHAGYDVEDIIERILDELNKTPYRCAVGYAFHNDGNTKEQTIALADAAMYENKKKSKQQMMK